MSSHPPAGRRHVEPKPNLPVFAGTLGHELRGHALHRAEHFFHFVVAMKVVVAELNAMGGPATPHGFSKWLSIKATDQIGSGLRSEIADYSLFVATDPKVIDKPTTQFTKSDAAHFCNLGVTGGMDAVCLASQFTRDGYERLKLHAGATMQLPQKVNIGPDRKIDMVHGRLALLMLDDDQPIFSRERVKVYHEQARAAITEYKLAKEALGEFGLAACARCYLDTYADNFEQRIFKRVYPEVIGQLESSAFFRGQSSRFLAW